MTNDECFQFHTLVYSYFKNCTLIETSAYEELYGRGIEDLDVALNQVRENEKTVEVTALDHTRDVLYSGTKRTNRAALHHFNHEIASSAHAIDIIFRGYKKPEKSNYPAETSMIYNLCQDLQNATYAPLAEKVGLTDWIVELKKANDAFEELFNDRAVQQSLLIAGLAREKRHEVETIYRSLISIANVNLLIDPSSPLLEFVDIINEQIAKCKQIIAARTTHNATKKLKKEQVNNGDNSGGNNDNDGPIEI